MGASLSRGRDPKRRVVENLSRRRSQRVRTELLQANQSLEAARDRLNQARSLARVATADFFPQLSTDPSAVRERGSGNRPLNGAQPTVISGGTQQVPPYTQNVFTIPSNINYEPDLFGRVRHQVEAANATLQSTAADLQNVQLVLTADACGRLFFSARTGRRIQRSAGVGRLSTQGSGLGRQPSQGRHRQRTGSGAASRPARLNAVAVGPRATVASAI